MKKEKKTSLHRLLLFIERREPVTKTEYSRTGVACELARTQAELGELLDQALEDKLVSVEVKYKHGRGGNPAYFSLTGKGRKRLEKLERK